MKKICKGHPGRQDDGATGYKNHLEIKGRGEGRYHKWGDNVIQVGQKDVVPAMGTGDRREDWKDEKAQGV